MRVVVEDDMKIIIEQFKEECSSEENKGKHVYGGRMHFDGLWNMIDDYKRGFRLAKKAGILRVVENNDDFQKVVYEIDSILPVA